ncbi:PAS domain S-box protein [Aquabacter sediminis]|uniref:PAS domain S-box protein n=1 Tax=Aquabacter sediminis TaxID=3029197 RepID=UPI00237E0D8C|nr:PAS domain S-box protein [Aquabacter sp. P-9]MDE1566676.1 PAS domain S-box protein [Aquabacter sp. P-9]
MSEPTIRTLPLNDPVFAPLHREDLPSFVVALPQGELVAATQACSPLGLAPHQPLPNAAAELARRIAARDHEAASQERISLPLSPEPQLFSCRSILTPTGQFVMFADPRSLSTSAQGTAVASSEPRRTGGGEPRAVRFTWEVDAAGRLTRLSESFRAALPLGDWTGQPFVPLLTDLGFSGGDTLETALSSQTTFSDIALEGHAGRLRLGGVALFSASRLQTGTRGFGQFWGTPAVQGAPGEPSLPPAVPEGGAAEPEAATPFSPPDVLHAPNVVPLRGGSLTPRERTAFHEIARTLHDAIDSWQKTGDAPPLPDVNEAPPIGQGSSTDGEEGVLDRLPLGVVVHQQGELVRVNRTLLSWCGDASMDDFEAAGGLPPRLSRPDAVKPLCLRTNEGAELPVEVRVVSATWAGRPALVHVVRRLDDAPPGNEVAATNALQQTLDLIPVGVVLLDRAGAIAEANETVGRYAGFPREDLRGEPFTALFATHSQSRAVQLLDEAALQEPPLPCSAVLTVRSRKGGDVQMAATLARVASEAQRYCLVLRPATESASSSLPGPVAGGGRADALDAPAGRAAVDALARRMSHAIRTPLTSILGFVDAVRSSTFGPVGNARYAKHAEAAQLAGQHLLAVLEDVEHLFPASPLGEPERVDLPQVLDAALAHLGDIIKRRRVLVRRDVPPTLACATRKAALEYVVRLLLEEAIRATPVGGQVMVSIRQDGPAVLLRVRDAGDALSEPEIAQALNALASAPVSDRFSAAGLPFRFARLSALVRAEGGTMSLQRGTGGGVLVDVSFPA